MFAWTSLKAAFVGADASVPVFKVPLQRNVEEISPEWGLGLLCLPLKKKKKKKRWSDLLLFSHLQLPICCSFFTTPPLRSFLLLLLLPPSLCPSASHWVRSRGVKQCWKFERRWMNSLKECKREWEWLGLRSLVWISLACGGAPLRWMNG